LSPKVLTVKLELYLISTILSNYSSSSSASSPAFPPGYIISSSAIAFNLLTKGSLTSSSSLYSSFKLSDIVILPFFLIAGYLCTHVSGNLKVS
jgi:fructose-specific phosphotransferase system IIC component